MLLAYFGTMTIQKKDHKRPSILAHSSSRTRENTNESISPRNETPKPTQKRLGEP
jgi:hypothetical protein